MESQNVSTTTVNPTTQSALNATPSESKNDDQTIRILIVEDDNDVRTLYTDLLANSDQYEVSTAVDGLDALAKCEATKYDLILLDIVMPNKDGVETLAEIKAHKDIYGDPIVLMFTNIGGDLAVEKALELGAVGYKYKLTTEPHELIKTIYETLKKYSPKKDLLKPLPPRPDDEFSTTAQPVPQTA